MENAEFSFPVSRQQQPVFPDSGETQRDALENDAGYLEMKRLRGERLKNDRFFPFYHYTASVGSINDPNGPCFWRGRWHLFYQQFYGGRVIWGHAVSRDLVDWSELPFAICPDTEGGCWSGSVCCDGEKAAALWYGHSNSADGSCGLYVAVSTDELLLNWKRVTAGPTIPSADFPLFEGVGDFDSVPYTRYPMLYDPCIWREGETYFALSAGVHENRFTGGLRRSENLFSSKNLTDWKFEHPFIADEAFSDTGDDGGCPYFLPIGDRHMLLHYSHKYGARYVLGHYDRGERLFYPTSGSRMNNVTQSSGYCAPAALPDPQNPGGALAIYVMHGMNGPALMSLPHSLRLSGKSGDYLAVSPAVSLEKLRKNHTRIESLGISKGETLLENIGGTSLELDVSIEREGAASPELRVFRSRDGSEYVSIKLYPGCGSRYKDGADWFFADTLVLDPSRSNPGLRAAPPETAEITSKPTTKLRIFLDRSVIEVFTEDGLSLGRRVFPSEGGALVSAVCDTGEMRLTADIWELSPMDDSLPN